MNIISFDGITRFGRITYADDGMLYIGRKQHGPYLVNKHFGGDYMAVRFSEAQNIHRFEALRWSLLLRLDVLFTHGAEALVALKKLCGRRKKYYGLYKNQWWVLKCDDGNVSKDLVEIRPDRVLDAMVGMAKSTEEEELVRRYLSLEDRIMQHIAWKGRIENCLQQLFRDLNPSAAYTRLPITVKVNGRNYIVHRGLHSPPDHVDSGWPNPGYAVYDLDAKTADVARYEPASS